MYHQLPTHFLCRRSMGCSAWCSTVCHHHQTNDRKLAACCGFTFCNWMENTVQYGSNTLPSSPTPAMPPCLQVSKAGLKLKKASVLHRLSVRFDYVQQKPSHSSGVAWKTYSPSLPSPTTLQRTIFFLIKGKAGRENTSLGISRRIRVGGTLSLHLCLCYNFIWKLSSPLHMPL